MFSVNPEGWKKRLKISISKLFEINGMIAYLFQTKSSLTGIKDRRPFPQITEGRDSRKLSGKTLHLWSVGVGVSLIHRSVCEI